MPTLPLIQHVFDYLLCRPPIFVVYLACTVCRDCSSYSAMVSPALVSQIVLSRKQDVERLEEEGEEGMMHSLLSALPEIVDGNDLPEEEIQPKVEALTEEITPTAADIPGVKRETPYPRDELSDVEPAGDLPVGQEPSVVSDVFIAEPELPPNEILSDIKPELPSPPSPDPSTEKLEDSPRTSRRGVLKPKPRTLTEILNMSDALHEAHPPSHPSLQLSSIMGPQSVVFTWSTLMTDMPANDEAECMVQRLDLVVYPEPPLVENEKEKNAPKRRRKRYKTRPPTVGLLVGAGLVLGVAVAVSVYSTRQGGDHTRDWRKLGRWAGGVFASASERIIRYRT
jgi:hypothetical protein